MITKNRMRSIRDTMKSRAEAARASGAVAPRVSNISATFFERGPMYSAPRITDTSHNSIASEIQSWLNCQRWLTRMTPAANVMTETGRK
jgi:hypothetical protein